MPANPLGRRLDPLSAAGEDLELQRAAAVKGALDGRGGRTQSIESLLRLSERGRTQAVADELGISRGTLWRWRRGQQAPSPEHRAALEDLALQSYVSSPLVSGRARDRLAQLLRYGARQSRFRGDIVVDYGNQSREDVVAIAYHLDSDELGDFGPQARAGNWRAAGVSFERCWFVAYFEGEWDGVIAYLRPRWERIESLSIEIGRVARRR